MAASTPLPLSLKALDNPSGGAYPTSGQPLRIKQTLLMAAAYNSGDDTNGPLSQLDSSLLGRTNRDTCSSTEGSPKSSPLPSIATHVERTSSAEGNEEDANLRTTCDACTISKIKCDGGHPCKRCLRRRSQCIYREKKRCGPKRRRSLREDGDDDGDTATGATSPEDGNALSHKVLTTKERQFLAKFYNSVNKFIPITCHTVIRDAMNPLPLDVIDGSTASEEDKNIHHARKALLLGCVALGAVFCGDADSAGAYMARAQIHLKDCFDALLPEVYSPFQSPPQSRRIRGVEERLAASSFQLLLFRGLFILALPFTVYDLQVSCRVVCRQRYIEFFTLAMYVYVITRMYAGCDPGSMGDSQSPTNPSRLLCLDGQHANTLEASPNLRRMTRRWTTHIRSRYHTEILYRIGNPGCGGSTIMNTQWTTSRYCTGYSRSGVNGLPHLTISLRNSHSRRVGPTMWEYPACGTIAVCV